MLNILVTGAKGFIGTNFLKRIDKQLYNILEFNRADTIKSLEEKIKKCDFIIHLAGEVRPNSSDDDFKNSNILLTQAIIDVLNKQDKTIPILMASTIHAKLLKNEYGKTKREAELLVEKYAKDKNIRSHICRLPHVFGEGCKPNYNSVVSTWIYNSINDNEIIIFDRNIGMHYAYVQDIVNEFISIVGNHELLDIYIEPKIVYETTLGEVIDFLDEFKKNINNSNYEISNAEFKQKLFATYLDYYKEPNV
ncbi:MAG: NAD-dependent epimerase/dehydratase family protein [Pseudomonadota bacterium]